MFSFLIYLFKHFMLFYFIMLIWTLTPTGQKPLRSHACWCCELVRALMCYHNENNKGKRFMLLKSKLWITYPTLNTCFNLERVGKKVYHIFIMNKIKHSTVHTALKIAQQLIKTEQLIEIEQRTVFLTQYHITNPASFLTNFIQY